MRLAPSERGGKARWVLYLLASALAVLLVFLVSAQTQGLASVTLSRAGPAWRIEGEMNATLARLALQLEELKRLATAQGEHAQAEVQTLRGELATLQRAVQESSKAIVAELASLHSMSSGSGHATAHKKTTPDEELQARFENIYAGQVWGPAGKGSGSGSSPENTVHTRELLLKTILDLNISSMIDVPCGAMAWMPILLEQVELQQPGFRYLGLDIARPVIDANKVVFANKTNWKFDVQDMTSQPLPKGYDLIHCRDALQHLSCPLIVNALQNFVLSGAKYLLVGSYDDGPNKNIQSGDYFSINLRLPPFSLSNPDAILSEQTPNEINKLQLLYRMSELAQKDFEAMRRGCENL